MKRLFLFSFLVCAALSVSAQNPYLPLWEHVPDGEPRVFEDPDNPGKLRAYIIGSHDTNYTAYDTMFAPDLVEVKDKATGKKTYYLYPHSRGWRRVAMVCKSDRPNGPFTPINLTEDGRQCVPGSLIDFDPSVFIENITDKKDKDYDKGFRAYVFYGFQHSTACELSPPAVLMAVCSTRRAASIRLSIRDRIRSTSTSSRPPVSVRWAIST